MVGTMRIADVLPSQHIVTYPMSDGEFINVVALVHNETREETYHEGPPIENVTNAEMLSVYEGYEPEVQALLEARQRFQ